MQSLIIKLEHETGLIIDERDTWKNQADFRLMENYQEALDDDCKGIPFFYNTETGEHLCGEINYKTLKNWAMGGVA